MFLFVRFGTHVTPVIKTVGRSLAPGPVGEVTPVPNAIHTHREKSDFSSVQISTRPV